jgi:hypothetical protein
VARWWTRRCATRFASYVAEADLVMMNIEGSEWDVLDDPRLSESTAVWIVEYHQIRNPTSDVYESVKLRFEHAGFATHLAMKHDHNGLIWAWKTGGIKAATGSPGSSAA